MQQDQALVNKLKVPHTQVRWFTLSSKKDEEEANKKNKVRAKGQDNKKQRFPAAKDEKRKQRASKSDVGDKNAISRSKAKRRQEGKALNHPSRREAPDSKVSDKKARFRFNKENTVITSKSKSSPMRTESSDNVLKRRMRTQVWHWSKASVKQNAHLMKLLADNKINIDDINVSRLHLNDMDIEAIGVKNRVLKRALLWLFR